MSIVHPHGHEKLSVRPTCLPKHAKHFERCKNMKFYKTFAGLVLALIDSIVSTRSTHLLDNWVLCYVFKM